jgi:LmbE family N-acetylglucosaminyl deacetylase
MEVTDLWETKIRALWEHKSQIGDPQALAERMRSRLAPNSASESPRYEENFRRIVFS